MNMIVQILLAFLSTIGFAVVFNIPSKSIYKAGITGALGWGVYLMVNSSAQSPVMATLTGAITVGIAGEYMAIRYRKPATVFIVPGIIPLVPGYGLYYTMLSVIQKQFTVAAHFGFSAISTALAISVGLIIASSLGKLYRSQRRKKRIALTQKS